MHGATEPAVVQHRLGAAGFRFRVRSSTDAFAHELRVQIVPRQNQHRLLDQQVDVFGIGSLVRVRVARIVTHRLQQLFDFARLQERLQQVVAKRVAVHLQTRQELEHVLRPVMRFDQRLLRFYGLGHFFENERQTVREHYTGAVAGQRRVAHVLQTFIRRTFQHAPQIVHKLLQARVVHSQQREYLEVPFHRLRVLHQGRVFESFGHGVLKLLRGVVQVFQSTSYH